MSAPFLKPWTQEQFFAWDGHQDGQYEFDGFRPVAMTGGTVNHAIITQNVAAALRGRLRGSGCGAFGPDVGIETIGSAVRYPDALVTCAKVDGTALTVPGAVVVFEVLSPSSGRTDRIVKLREYAAVASVLGHSGIHKHGLAGFRTDGGRRAVEGARADRGRCSSHAGNWDRSPGRGILRGRRFRRRCGSG
jgi:hypothetical protein